MHAQTFLFKLEILTKIKKTYQFDRRLAQLFLLADKIE